MRNIVRWMRYGSLWAGRSPAIKEYQTCYQKTQHSGHGQNKKDKQWSAKQTQKINDWSTQSSLKIRVELRCSGWISSSCPTCVTRRVTIVSYLVLSHAWRKDKSVIIWTKRNLKNYIILDSLWFNILNMIDWCLTPTLVVFQLQYIVAWTNFILTKRQYTK